jgi:putative tricarboxylic transport membrane protein
LGFLIGVLPGAGGTIATFLSYDLAKRTSKRGHLFGTGALRASRLRNAQTTPLQWVHPSHAYARCPRLQLDRHHDGALIMFGLTPGPFLFSKNPEFAWGLIVSLYIGNVLLLILAVCCLPLFVQIIKSGRLSSTPS